MSTDEESSKDSVEDQTVENLDELLSLPEGFLYGMSSTEGFEVFISKLKEYVEGKEAQIEDYQTTLKEFEENLEQQDSVIGE